jgi:hypothetical protein
MSRHCFCCPQQPIKVPRRLRGVNRWGQKLREDMTRVQVMIANGLLSPNADEFIRQARQWCEAFAEAVHSGVEADKAIPGFTNSYLSWLRSVGPFLGEAQLGMQVRAAGLSADEAFARLRAGEWDPFENVRMPSLPPFLKQRDQLDA